MPLAMAGESKRAMTMLRRMLRALPGARMAAARIRALRDPDFGMVERLRRTAGGALFQPYTDTWDERYPELFDRLAVLLALLPAPRILSFGCSSGAEVRALRRRLPGARITGIDINPRMIARAIAADPSGTYRVAATPDPGERFDTVLALAVFRHGILEAEQPDDCAPHLPFARFAEGTTMLDAVLEPGGWLAVWNAHFRFADTPAGARYTADPLRMADPHQPLVYGPDNRKLPGGDYPPALYRKDNVKSALRSPEQRD
jgi:SAM-dependent methyltransferase